MEQPTQCVFCGKPRHITQRGNELWYLVDISGPYLESFDAEATNNRSTNRKLMWGCHDCVNVIQDTEYWMRYDESTGRKPYALLDDWRHRVLQLKGQRPGKQTQHQAARDYAPVPLFRKPGRKVVND